MSANASILKPVLPSPFPDVPKYWRCPKTGLLVPKDPTENLQWRAKLLAEAEDDEDLQQELYTACSQSLLFWVNAFAFTFRIQDTDERGVRRQAKNQHLPFVTWTVQDLHMQEVERAIDAGYDLLTDKTRDMGSTWSHIAVLHHQWLFRENRLFLEMSRVETDVDGADNPRCLFVKHDYLNRWLPEWMLPRITRTRMHLVNEDNGSRIDGESSNEAAGSGDRRHAILMDEFAKMQNSEKIKAATADVTPCRLPNSTPWGAGTTYSNWRQSAKIKVFVLPWWEHPEKGANRYVVQDETARTWRIRSPWYDEEDKKRSRKEMATEIDMDHVNSGDTFFEAHVVEEHRRLFGCDPTACRSIDFKKTISSDAVPEIIVRRQLDRLQVNSAKKGPLHIWANLIAGRLDQTRTYVLGVDVSRGQGASNSVISVVCKETGEKVAEWADANTPPYDFARIACAVALWVGGASSGGRPLMVWEANGPGWDFGREVVKKYQYPLYWVDRASGTLDERRGKRYGWHSSAEKKEVVLGMYRRALAHGGFVNHSREALNEALTYVRYGDGGIGPATLMEESANARKTHGDRVIADMLALFSLGDAPRAHTSKPVAPGRSFASRKQAWDKSRKASEVGKMFDFTA
jgi:hypothetical protein